MTKLWIASSSLLAKTTLRRLSVFTPPSRRTTFRKLSKGTRVATILNLCPDLHLPRANRWTDHRLQSALNFGRAPTLAYYP